MTVEELQDHALKLQEQLEAEKHARQEQEKKYGELNDLNLALQKRNNELFLKVAQKGSIEEPEGKEEPTALSCEDFTKKYVKEIIR